MRGRRGERRWRKEEMMRGEGGREERENMRKGKWAGGRKEGKGFLTYLATSGATS